MTDVKRNPDGTVALPTEPEVRHGKQMVFYYKDSRATAPEAFTTQVITYYPDEGDTVEREADGSLSFMLQSTPRPTEFSVRPTWDYRLEYDVELVRPPTS
jgi:hypothetical protein